MTAPRTLTPDAWSAFEARLGVYVRRRVDSVWADDVLGDILLRLVQHRGQFESAANPSAWMFRLAANAIADHYRRRAAEQRATAQLEAADQDGRESTTQGDGSASAELAQCLLPLIRCLPEPYGEALRLTAIEGLTQTVAATRLGLSTSGMKSRVQRGRAKLKQALLRCCEVQVDRQGGVVGYQPRFPGSKNCTL